MSAPTNSQTKTRVALIGAGEFGRNHARVYREMENVEFVGVFDSDPAKAAAVGKEFQVPVIDKIADLKI